MARFKRAFAIWIALQVFSQKAGTLRDGNGTWEVCKSRAAAGQSLHSDVRDLAAVTKLQ